MSSTYQITKNLSSSEVACPCCGQVQFDEQFVTLLQLLRDIVGVPLHYSSFFRCALHNQAIGGAQNSYHKLGIAADILNRNLDFNLLHRFICEALRLQMTCGIYPAHIHVDLRKNPGFYYGTYK